MEIFQLHDQAQEQEIRCPWPYLSRKTTLGKENVVQGNYKKLMKFAGFTETLKHFTDA